MVDIQSMTGQIFFQISDLIHAASEFNPLPLSDTVRKQKKKYVRGSFQFTVVNI